MTQRPSQRFPPAARLRVSAQFKAVFEGGKRSSSPHFRLHALVRADDGAARLGVAVSKRVDKRAVGRNRIKRIARECFRRQAGLPALDLVLIAKPEAKQADDATLRAEFEALLERARSLKPPAPTGTMPASPGARERPTPDP